MIGNRQVPTRSSSAATGVALCGLVSHGLEVVSPSVLRVDCPYTPITPQFLHRVRALIQSSFLFRRQLDFDDLLDSLRSQLHRQARELRLGPVLPEETFHSGKLGHVCSHESELMPESLSSHQQIVCADWPAHHFQASTE